MLEWIGLREETAFWIAVASAAMAFSGLILVPLVVIWLPADHFARPRRAARERCERGWLRLVGRAVKNALGLALLVLGAFMLVLPGQGVLTLLVAITLLDFPGKFRLERWAITRRGVMEAANWIRRKRGKDPLILDPQTGSNPGRP